LAKAVQFKLSGQGPKNTKFLKLKVGMSGRVIQYLYFVYFRVYMTFIKGNKHQKTDLDLSARSLI